MLAGHEVLRLQLFTRARREAHAKVRQSFIPRTRNAHLLGTVLSGQFSNGVQIFSGTFRPEEFRGCVKPLTIFNAALEPNFIDTLVLPVSKQADAISAGLDCIKVIFHFSKWHVFVHMLAHQEGWLNIERNLCDYAQRSKANNCSPKYFAVSLAG